mmetsp:Transcript_10031/g.25041  ORF Transcript_10031/g.25041 Transcript_10031/m.25041 type:complete len:98 (-) Transcript_10031:1218-1511(-)
MKGKMATRVYLKAFLHSREGKKSKLMYKKKRTATRFRNMIFWEYILHHSFDGNGVINFIHFVSNSSMVDSVTGSLFPSVPSKSVTMRFAPVKSSWAV